MKSERRRGQSVYRVGTYNTLVACRGDNSRRTACRLQTRHVGVERLTPGGELGVYTRTHGMGGTRGRGARETCRNAQVRSSYR